MPQTNPRYELLPQIVDAFGYNTLFYRQHKPYNYFILQLERLAPLRRASSDGTYRLRQYVTPLNVGISVPALSTRKEQVRIVPGSYIWAVTFSVVESGGSITDFNITLADHDLNANGENGAFYSSSVSGALSNYPLMQLLDEPRVMLGSGQLDVTFVNRVNSTRTPQLVISCAEPCVVATEGN